MYLKTLLASGLPNKLGIFEKENMVCIYFSFNHFIVILTHINNTQKTGKKYCTES